MQHNRRTIRRGLRKSLCLALMVSALAAPAGFNSRAQADAAPASTFPLFVNPGLAAGKPFACPAMQNAAAYITVTNRFATDALNDVMTLTASGLPPKTGFDVFLVEHSPISNTAFAGFGQGWYQSDMESDDEGRASVVVQGIFDNETFIEDASAPFAPVHTFDVGFWFDSPTTEQQVCGNATAPAITPFNGAQNAGLLAMATAGEPLQTIGSAAPGVGVNLPVRGASPAGVTQRFTTICSDRHGWRHLHTIELKLTDGRHGRGARTPLALWVQYDQNTNTVRLYDPRSHTWQHGKPGARRVLSNGYAALNLAATRIFSAGPKSRSVQITWAVTFTARALANNYRQSLRIVDDAGATLGWHVIGSWSIVSRRGVAPHAGIAPRSTYGYDYGTPSPTPSTPPVATATNTPLPAPTNTPVPAATNTPAPAATSTPLPAATSTPVPAATNTPLPAATNTPVPPTATPAAPCTAATCTFALGLNPGLAAGKPFACPAMQQATASIAIANRFPSDAPNDTLTLTAAGLPPNAGFDLFLVENSPLDGTTFNGFGSGWYQSDVQSDAQGQATVTVRGIFDKETFIENPANGLTPTHTFNVGFWFNSPAEEQQLCGNATAPAVTPFNGEQTAGLLAMITQGKPLQLVQ